MKTPVIVVVLVAIVALLLGGGFLLYHNSPPSQHAIFPAPTTSVMPSSTLATSPVPTSPPSTKYISPVDWPPKVSTENKPFSCLEAGSEQSTAGQTKKIIVNNHTYCVTKETQGAAGSIYTQYAYAVAKGDQTEIFTFSLRFVQCDNYPESEKTTCENESQSFNVDTFMDQYIQSHS